jgi:hypothetical protein
MIVNLTGIIVHQGIASVMTRIKTGLNVPTERKTLPSVVEHHIHLRPHLGLAALARLQQLTVGCVVTAGNASAVYLPQGQLQCLDHFRVEGFRRFALSGGEVCLSQPRANL